MSVSGNWHFSTPKSQFQFLQIAMDLKLFIDIDFLTYQSGEIQIIQQEFEKNKLKQLTLCDK